MSIRREQPQPRAAVVLVGHGGVAKDCPREWVTRLKALEGRRRVSNEPPSAEERELDERIRSWPRTTRNDPYRAGVEALADELRPLLGERELVVAYNEFCAPSVEEAVGSLVARGVDRISVVPTMLTPGGVHSEVEIPEAIERLRTVHPGVAIDYAWPFDLGRIAAMLRDQLDRSA